MRLLGMIRIILALVSVPAALAAQSAVPGDRYVLSRDVDFYGADLTSYFDTTLDACKRACSAQPGCVAFTFNTRSNACFPKGAVIERKAYEGALSALRVRTSAQVLQQSDARAADLAFLGAETLAAARDLVQANADRNPDAGYGVEQLASAAQTALEQGQQAQALAWLSAAIALSDRGDLWTRQAELALELAPNVPGRDVARSRALAAAANGYLRADGDPARVTALLALSRALEAEGRGRDMVSALRLAESIQPRADVTGALEAAIAKYGFRVTDTQVDSDAAAPRICVVFSEGLVKAGVDYDPFVRSGATGLAVAPEGQQLCIDGVEHGTRYQITLRRGLPAASGEVLAKDVPLALYVRDRAPSVRFPGRAYVLPRTGDAALPVETVNLDRVDLALRRVSDRNLLRAIQDSYFGRPLSQYQDGVFASEIAEEIWTGTGEVRNALNADMTTRLPMDDAISGLPAGIYALTARVPGADPYDDPGATQWFVLSDLGLSTWAGDDGVQVAVRSLGDASARAGIALTLVSRANAVLGRTVTGADGFASFPAGLSRGDGASAPALLIAEDGEEDIAFLSLGDPAFDLSDRGVEGRPPAPPIDTFLATDRGAYRAGDTIHVTALTRDALGGAIDGLPLTAVLKRPDGVDYSRTLAADTVAGGHVFALPVGASAPRGTWRLELFADTKAPALASQTVLVEDFLPERLDFTLRLPDAPIAIGSAPPVAVQADYLFGAPAADLPVEGEVRLSATRSLAGFDGYLFGRHDARFDTRTAYLSPVRTDASGAATLPLALPDASGAELPLQAEVIVRVSEGSGRPVERRLTVPLASAGPLIGIKPLFEGPLGEGANAGFELIAVGGEEPIPVRWTVNRVETRYQWYQLYGNWNWEPTTRRIREASGEAVLGEVPQPLEVAAGWGDYELVVERIDGTYAASSAGFSAGWSGGGDGTATPDRLDLSLDRQSYAPGDTVRARILSETDGIALISVLSNRVIERRAVAVAAGETIVPLTVTDEWGSGAYVTASVLHGLDAADGRVPARSLGLAHAAVAPGGKLLRVSLQVPDTLDGQAGTFPVTVQVDGVAPGETAHVTLAAVDQGILNLTGFAAPDPVAHYFGQRRLGVDLRDIYGRLIDGRNGEMGRIRSGGDAGPEMGLQSPPPTEELMAAFSGPVTVGADGRAEILVAKPAFNGTIRLMAIAWSGRAVGAAQREVTARDPVVLSASMPRFLAPGDDSRLLLELTATSVPSGDVMIDVTGPGVMPAPFNAALAVQQGANPPIRLPLRADAVGDHPVTVTLTLPGGTRLTKELTLPVRRNDPETAATRRFTLGPGEAFTFDGNVLAGFRPGTASATLSAGPLARFDVPGLLRQLDRYPYGCTEQITSAALPLLYLADLAPGAGVRGVPEKIRAAIARVLTRQAGNGAFGLWSAEPGDFWLDAYVVDFLSRARTEGFDVPETAFATAMDNLRNRVNYAPDFDLGGEDIAYALLVLAREGAAGIGDLRYYADTRAEAFATPMAAAQLGAALAAYGDPLRADRMFARAGAMLRGPDPAPKWRGDYGTPLRDAAAVLALAAEAGSQAVDRAALAQRIGGAGRSLSTQEAAQVLLASHALAGEAGPADLSLDGAPARGPLVQTLAEGQPASVIANTGGQATDVTLTVYGVPDVAPDAGGYGYAITREYFDMQGNPRAGVFRAGDRVVAVLTVTPFEGIGARLIIDDPLPAGLEIDNPNLIRAGDIGALDWLETEPAEHAEFRSDRFVAAVDHAGTDPFRLAYVLRAVSPGDFHHPAALVQDMYRPEYRAVTATGRIAVAE